MSADSNSKHISMNGLPYDKMKGLTPVSNKSGAPLDMKNGQHFGVEEQRQEGNNSRNNNNRMPSLPSSIKGSIGGQNMAQISNGSKRNVVHPGMPLNIAANDIKFSGSYN